MQTTPFQIIALTEVEGSETINSTRVNKKTIKTHTHSIQKEAGREMS